MRLRSVVFFFSLLPVFSAVALPKGEVLYYRAHWNGITGGYAQLSILNERESEESVFYDFELKAKSGAILDSLYPVRYGVATSWNATTRLPVRVRKKIRHGRFQIRYAADFAENGVSYELKGLDSSVKNPQWKTRKNTVNGLPPGSQDLLSAFYFLRTDDRKPENGIRFLLPVYDDGTFRNISFQVDSFEKIPTISGDIDCMVIRTDFQTRGFLSSTGLITAWVSNDENRYPYRISLFIPVLGKVQVDLVKIHPGVRAPANDPDE